MLEKNGLKQSRLFTACAGEGQTTSRVGAMASNHAKAHAVSPSIASTPSVQMSVPSEAHVCYCYHEGGF